jgi:hypothetical protein
MFMIYDRARSSCFFANSFLQSDFWRTDFPTRSLKEAHMLRQVNPISIGVPFLPALPVAPFQLIATLAVRSGANGRDWPFFHDCDATMALFISESSLTHRKRAKLFLTILVSVLVSANGC